MAAAGLTTGYGDAVALDADQRHIWDVMETHVPEPSGHTYTFTRNPNGTTDFDAVVVREGKNLKGRASGSCFDLIAARGDDEARTGAGES